MNIDDKVIAVIGLGYVGLPLATEFGLEREVIGYDISAERINDLRAGVDRTRELEPVELMSAQYLRYTSEIQDLSAASIYIVTVPKIGRASCRERV